jgi:hypothetical protein
MNSPSINTLENVFPGKGKELRKVLEMSRDELILHPAGAKRYLDCYHPPTTEDLRLCVLDSVAETYGVEYISSEGDDYNSFSSYEYLNVGDSYSNTIVYDLCTKRYKVACLGDLDLE